MKFISFILFVLALGNNGVQAGEYPDRAMNKDERKLREAVLKEIKDKSADCGVYESKREMNEAWGKAFGVTEDSDPMIQKFIVISGGLKDLTESLKKSGVTLEFAIEKDLEDKCKFSDDALHFNFGAVEALMYVKRMQDLVAKLEGRKYKMTILRIELTRLFSRDLYEKNRSPEVVDEVRYEKQADGTEIRKDVKVARIFVNAGDYETGVILFPLMDALVGK